MPDNRLGELPWLIDTTTGRPNGVRTQRGEEIAVAYVDPATGQLAASGAPVSGAGKVTVPGWPRNRLIRGAIDANQTVAANQPNMTWQHMVQFDAPFDAVRPIILNSNTATQAGVTFACASGPSWADKVGNALTWVSGTWAGSASGTLAAGAAARPSVNVPDLCYVQSVPRNDGGSGHVAYVRLYLPTNSTAPQCLHQSGDYNQWTGLARGAMHVNRWAGDGVSSIASYSPGAGRADSPIWAIEVLSRGQSLGIVAVGDSITAGTGASAILRRNWAERAAVAQSAVGTNVPIGVANGGFPGQTSSQYVLRALDIITAIKPPVLVYSPWTPNDFPGGGGPVTDTVINLMRANLARVVDACRSNGVLPVIWTGLPCASKGINAASDAFRVAFNNEIRSVYAGQVLIWDADSVMTDGAAPASIPAALTADNLHPNDAGYDVMAAAFTSQALGPLLAANR